MTSTARARRCADNGTSMMMPGAGAALPRWTGRRPSVNVSGVIGSGTTSRVVDDERRFSVWLGLADPQAINEGPVARLVARLSQRGSEQLAADRHWRAAQQEIDRYFEDHR